MMQRIHSHLLFGAVLYAGTLAAQTPNSTANQAPAPVQTQPQTMGVGAPERQPDQAPQTREQQEAAVKAQAEHMAQMQSEAFARQLSLTPIQINRLKPILADRQKALRALVPPSNSETPAETMERQAKVQKIQDEMEARIMGILNPAQKVQYQHLIAMHRNERARRSSAMLAARRKRMQPAAPPAPASTAAPAASPDAKPATPPAAPPQSQ